MNMCHELEFDDGIWKFGHESVQLYTHFDNKRKVKLELDGYMVYNVCFQCTHINIIVMIISSNKHHYLCCIMVVPIKIINGRFYFLSNIFLIIFLAQLFSLSNEIICS